MELQQFGTEKTFSSRYLVEQINLFRTQDGNRAELRHSDFLVKTEREFEEEINERKISLVNLPDAKGELRKSYELNYEQSLQILMSESKIVRKAVIEVLKKQQELISNSIPKTYGEALIEAGRLALELDIAKHTILEQKPKVEFADQLLSTTNAIDFGTCAKAMQLPFGRNKLFQICRDNKWLFNKNQPKQELVDRGYFVVLESSYINPSTMDTMMTTKTLITAKGQEWLMKQLKKLNLL